MDEVHLQFMHASNIEITLIFINMHAERHGKPVNYSDAMCLIQRLFTIPVHCRWGCSHQSILIEKFNSLKLSPHEHNHNWSPSLDSVFPFLSLSLSQSLFFQLPCHYENENTKQKLLSIYIVMNAAFWFRAIILPLQIAHTQTIGVQSVKRVDGVICISIDLYLRNYFINSNMIMLIKNEVRSAFSITISVTRIHVSSNRLTVNFDSSKMNHIHLILNFSVWFTLNWIIFNWKISAPK